MCHAHDSFCSPDLLHSVSSRVRFLTTLTTSCRFMQTQLKRLRALKGVQTEVALLTTLPCTAEMASTCTPGWLNAIRMAWASSTPASAAIIIADDHMVGDHAMQMQSQKSPQSIQSLCDAVWASAVLLDREMLARPVCKWLMPLRPELCSQ